MGSDENQDSLYIRGHPQTPGLSCDEYNSRAKDYFGLMQKVTVLAKPTSIDDTASSWSFGLKVALFRAEQGSNILEFAVCGNTDGTSDMCKDECTRKFAWQQCRPLRGKGPSRSLPEVSAVRWKIGIGRGGYSSGIPYTKDVAH